MRDKEVKTDYRFMPEPNLPPLHLFDSESVKTVSSKMSVINIDDIQQKLPPLPEDTRKRLEQQYSLKRRDVAVLVVRMCNKDVAVVVICLYYIEVKILIA